MKNVRWKSDKRLHVTKEMRSEVGLALDDFAEHVLGVSNTYVPLEEGTLERSGNVDTDFAKLKSTITYDTPYAEVQHEDTTLRHDNGRRAKYLETALNEEADKMVPFIGSRVRGVLR